MLLVASETGHVYTFATRKLQPMITSEAGKALIQTCLNSPDPSGAPGTSGADQRMSATGFEETELTYNISDEDTKVRQLSYGINMGGGVGNVATSTASNHYNAHLAAVEQAAAVAAAASGHHLQGLSPVSSYGQCSSPLPPPPHHSQHAYHPHSHVQHPSPHHHHHHPPHMSHSHPQR